MDPVTVATAAVSVLSPYLVKVGEKAAEEVGKRLPDLPGKLWNAIIGKFRGKPAAEEAVQDLLANPDDDDNRAAFRKELRKVLETDASFAAEFERLLGSAQGTGGDTITVTGSGAAATRGGTAAGAGGVAVRGDVHGGVNIGGAEKKG
jgi:hypothetical protein